MKRWMNDFFTGVCMGRSGRNLRIALAAGLLVGLIWMVAESTVFYVRYEDGLATYSRVYDSEGNSSWVPEKLDDINTMMSGVFRMLPVLLAAGIAIAVTNYLSFYYPNRSVFIMRRVRHPWEMHLRCLAFPVCWMLVTILICYLLGHHYLILYKSTDPERLPDRILLNIWRTLVW